MSIPNYPPDSPENPYYIPPGVLQQFLNSQYPAEQPLAVQPTEAQPPVAQAPIQEDPLAINPELNPALAANSTQSTLQQVAQAQDIGQSKINQQQLEAAAAAEQADALSKVDEATASAQEGALGGFAQAKDEAKRKADARIDQAALRVKELNDKEPDPKRLWTNMGGGQKAAYLISMVASVFATGGDINASIPAMDMLRAEINKDVDQQMALLARQREQAAGDLQEAKQQKREDLSEVEQRYSAVLGRLASIDKMARIKAAAAGGNLRMRAGYEGVRQEVVKEIQNITAKYGDKLHQEETRLAEFQQSKQLQSRGFAHARQMQANDFAEKERLASVEFQRDLAKAGIKNQEDYRQIPTGTGLTVVTNQTDEKGNKVVVDPNTATLHKDYVKDASAIAANANQLDADLAQLRDMLDDKNGLDLIISTDGKFNSQITELARRIATNPQFNKGATGDKDVVSSFDFILGRDANGGYLSKAAGYPQKVRMMREALTRFHNDLPDDTNRALKQFPVPGGGSLSWTPPERKVAVADEGKYLLPGEKESRLAAGVIEKSGRNDTSVSPTNLKPMTQGEIKTAQKLEKATEGMTVEGAAALVTSELSPDAAKRFMLANEERWDRARKRLEEVAINTVKANAPTKTGYESYRPEGRGYWNAGGKFIDEKYVPTREEFKKELVKAGFAVGKLGEGDYDRLREIASKWNTGHGVIK